MALSKQVREIYRDDKLCYIQYETNFMDKGGSHVTYCYDLNNKTYTDVSSSYFKLMSYELLEDERHDLLSRIAKSYQCELFDHELRSNKPEQLLQAMMAVCAWIEFKEWEL